MGAKITVDGVGFTAEVEVAAGETVADALKKAGIDPEKAGIDLSGSSGEIDPDSVRGSDLANGERLAATPKKAALG